MIFLGDRLVVSNTVQGSCQNAAQKRRESPDRTVALVGVCTEGVKSSEYRNGADYNRAESEQIGGTMFGRPEGRIVVTNRSRIPLAMMVISVKAEREHSRGGSRRKKQYAIPEAVCGRRFRI
jgi:hypothetical protein